MRTVHVVVPAGIEDPSRPSGGNVYDLRVCRELASRGWRVERHDVPGDWPRAGAEGRAAVEAVLLDLADRSVVFCDGLIGSAVGDLLAAVTDRLRLVLLIHLPLGVGATAEEPLLSLERLALGAARRVVATSGWTRDWLLARHDTTPSHLVVARPGTDPSTRTTPGPYGSRLLSVGALTSTKGQDRVLAALNEVRELDWHWTCVGSAAVDPAYVEELRDAVAVSGLGSRVTMNGPLGPEGLGEAYAACDLLVVGSRHETYGMVVGEALARGIPVVAPPVGGIAEALGSAHGELPGIIAATDDEAGLGDALRTWLTDKEVRDRAWAAAASRRTSLITWSATTDAVERALNAAAVETG